MTRQEMARQCFIASLICLFFLGTAAFVYIAFPPNRQNLQEIKNRPAVSQAEHNLAMKHLGGMRMHDTYYLKKEEL